MDVAFNGDSKDSETLGFHVSRGVTMHTAGTSEITSNLRDTGLIGQERSKPSSVGRTDQNRKIS